MNIIECIAEAIWQGAEDFDPWVSEQRRHLPKRTWENVEECERESARRDALAAVKAMREPTEEMITAGLIPTTAWQNIEGSALTVNREKMRLRFRAMIEACLTSA